jgi:uncharacterized small protein (DUF1192 family)
MLNREALKMLFRTSARPLQQDYWNWLDSYFHKEEKIPISSVEDLSSALSQKADSDKVAESLSGHNLSGTSHEDIRDLIALLNSDAENMSSALSQKADSDEVAESLSEHNLSGTSHQDIRYLIALLNSDAENMSSALSQKADSDEVAESLSEHNLGETSHQDIRNLISLLDSRLTNDNFDSTKDARLTGRKKNGVPIWRLDVNRTVESGNSLCSVDFPYEKIELATNYKYQAVKLYGTLVSDSLNLYHLSGGPNMVFDLNGLGVPVYLYDDDGIRLSKEDGGNFEGYECFLTLEFVILN